jgi:methylated-DNA-[protein]-cysteine S-methyltransferase
MILDGTTVSSPIGELGLVARDDRLVGLEFQTRERAASGWAHLARHLGPLEIRPHDDPAGAATRLARYFAGDLGALDEQPVELHGTEFQRAIWNALRTIPVGATWTYAEIAARIGRPSAVRAAGAANGANPVAVFVPCHRVIAADGTLWGYGGGLERKRWLLTHEGAGYRSSSSMTSLNFSNG